jgi:hypothetical protein
MTLDANQLSSALKDVFANGMTATGSDEVAEALAQAIHAYVTKASVDDVEVNVVDANGSKIGSGKQIAPVTVS